MKKSTIEALLLVGLFIGGCILHTIALIGSVMGIAEGKEKGYGLYLILSIVCLGVDTLISYLFVSGLLL